MWISAPIYGAAYAGFGATVSVFCRRNTQAILAGGPCCSFLLSSVLLYPILLDRLVAGTSYPSVPPWWSIVASVWKLPDPAGPSLW
ncbi:MAG: hypothetical protein ACUVX8_15100, partial [Candidatus Zipacnadales bacterium]